MRQLVYSVSDCNHNAPVALLLWRFFVAGSELKRGVTNTEPKLSPRKKGCTDYCRVIPLECSERDCRTTSISDPVITAQLLMQAGDVESNPGPTSKESKLHAFIIIMLFKV